MTRLISLKGVVVEAEDAAACSMLDSGFFRLADGEAMPDPTPEPEPEPEEGTAPEPALDATAFGTVEQAPDYSSMTNAELRALAETLGLTPPKKATKERLVELIEGAGA